MSAISIDLPQIANYQAISLIHESDRTLVYRGQNIENGQFAIIKLMRNQYPSFNELVQFRNQYAISKNLKIEGIVRPYALERHENRYALIMEDVEGISLAEYKRKNPLSLSQFFNIAIQLTDILHQLYQNQIIHKDIKPANILILSQTQQIKLIDFSISTRLLQETQTVKTPNILEGTLAYISPEQTGRMNRGIDYRSDFYASGVTLYELLTGRLPFNSDDLMELVHAHIARQPIPPWDELNENRENYPQSLSDIILKLMAKNAEERYQSALGLKHDLEKCQQRWQEQGAIAPFVLGERDLCDRFLIPEKLYGREEEVRTLLAAFERVSGRRASERSIGSVGASELLLVAGFSGIGKTAVINEVHKPIVEARGYFIKGKFDQFNRNIPFSAFVQAFRNLMEQLLGESDTELAHWKAKILAAVGENGQVLVEVIPELERIIGEQPPIPKLSGSAAQNRFNLLFENFIGVFTTKAHPLVIFLDDLQWADSASLNLLKVLMKDTQTGYLLLLGAYRDNEVFDAHPLMLSLAELRCDPGESNSPRERAPRETQQTKITTITLSPLSIAHINQLIAETLSCPLDLAVPLTDLVYPKTKGNPFFTTQFLKGLYEDEAISFNPDLGYWQCDLVKVRDATLTDDVVEFMMGRLQKLSEETQNILKLAACIGNQFDLETLAIICETSPEDVATVLWSSLREGLILPQSEAYKFFQEWSEEDAQTDGSAVSYRFLHDRIQQAAYSLIWEEEKKSTHLKIGQLLLKNTPIEKQEENIFTIINQLNYGVELLDMPTQRDELASLNLMAGSKALAATAYEAALRYLTLGIQLLSVESWTDQYQLTLSLYEKAIEAEYLNSNFERVEMLSQIVIERGKSMLDKAKVYSLLIQSYMAQNQALQAVEFGLSVLAEMGYFLDFIPEDGNLSVELPEGNLAEIPMMNDPSHLAALQLMTSLSPPIFATKPELWPSLTLTQVNLCLKYGYSNSALTAIALYGQILCCQGELNAAYRAGDLAMKLLERFNAKQHQCQIYQIFYSHIRPRKKPIVESLGPLREAISFGLETGDFEWTGYTLSLYCSHIFWSGLNLEIVSQDQQKFLDLAMKIKQNFPIVYAKIWKQMTDNLQGLVKDKTRLIGTSCNEVELQQSLIADNNLTLLFQLYLAKSILLYLFEEPEFALNYALLAEENLAGVTGMIVDMPHNFYYSLSLLAQYPKVDPERQKQYLERVTLNQKKMQDWVKHSPENCDRKYNLVEAEKNRVLGEFLEAITLYDKAIASAKENCHIQEEALANECFAQFYLGWGRNKEASIYMQEAYYCYSQWGAKAKIQDLEERYSPLLSPILAPKSPRLPSLATIANTTARTVTQASLEISNVLDFSSLMKAARTLSREIDRDRAIANLMQVIQENAGAQTVALMLLCENTLILETQIADGQIQSLERHPVKESQVVPLAIINTVKRTSSSLILDSAIEDITYMRDPYIQEHQPRSILCLPLQDRGQLIGILYLENNQATGAFTSDRVEVLELLCAQAAIALENGRLYQQARQALQLERELHELQKTQLQLIQSEKMFSLGQMVAGIAHEINNPINFIYGNVTYANEYMDEVLQLLALYQDSYPQPPRNIQMAIDAIDLPFLQKDFSDLLQSMRTGSARIKTIVASLRTFARLDESEFKKVDLHEGLESTLTILHTRLQRKETREAIQVLKEYGDLPRVECYAGQLNQVFMNILSNALDALESCDRQEYLAIRIRTETDGKQVKIAISDNGIGMSEEVKERLFDPFFTTKPVGQGTGLGMAIAHQIVTEKHEGAIACYSELGQGTEFIISLPCE